MQNITREELINLVGAAYSASYENECEYDVRKYPDGFRVVCSEEADGGAVIYSTGWWWSDEETAIDGIIAALIERDELNAI